jgi:hypothetical protein
LTGKLTFSSELCPERFPLDERHGVVGEPVGRPGCEQRHDVGMLERGGEVDLASKLLHFYPRPEVRWEDLYYHLAAEG